MNSKIYNGFVEHERFHPVGHRLRYPLYVYALDLDELAVLDHRLPLFGYNRMRPVSLFDKDYLSLQPGSIRHKLLGQLSAHGAADGIAQVMVVTSARLMGYVFNPVTFYLCFDKDSRLLAAVAEVNNTFGEKHVYVLSVTAASGSTFPVRFQAEKAFHVSPFNTMDGTYTFHFSDIRRELDIRIDLHRKGKHVLTARLWGQPRPLTIVNHLKTVLRHPMRPHLTIPRIYMEAFKLRFQRKLAYHDKPVPISPMTLRRLPPTAFQRYCMKAIVTHLSATRHGRLKLTLPDGKVMTFGDPDAVDVAQMVINDYRFFPRVVLGADIGLGEAFMADEWDTDDIAATIGFFIRNRDTLKDGDFKSTLLTKVLEKWRFISRSNTVAGSRRNIRRHYDLSNDFFRTFLDGTMAYSCAIFKDANESLEAAQRRKFRTIIEKARLHEADHLLEIGCGWGGFAIEAVRQSGCRVTGITISRQQYDLARERVRAAGVADRIQILFRDYRDVSGQYDKIVSIEMLEAVGHAHFKTFFRQVDRLLALEGIAVIQAITIPDQYYDAYRKTHDWIQKHIFPGGLLPSLTTMVNNMTRHTRLMVDHVENIGNHYATTLAHWHRRYTASRDLVSQLGFDRTFQRKWAYYLGTCEAAFRARVLGNLQLVLTREGNSLLKG